jgi:hypothetical protein
MAEAAMIQIMQQLQIGNQAIRQALSQQQEQLNQQQEASHQQMRRLEAMIVNIAQQSSGVALQDEHLAEGAQDVIAEALPLFGLTEAPTDKAYSPADEEEIFQEWMESAPADEAYSPTDEETFTQTTAPAVVAHSPAAEETDVQTLAEARARERAIQSTPSNVDRAVVQKTLARELGRTSHEAPEEGKQARGGNKPRRTRPRRPVSAEAKTHYNKKRAARRKARATEQATTAPEWHAAKRETLSWE